MKNVAAVGEIRNWISETGVDVVVTNTATVSAIARVRKMPVPVVYFCHGLHWNRSNDVPSLVWKAAERYLLRNTSGVVAINSDDEAWFRRLLPPENVLRLQGGVGVPISSFPRTPLPPNDIPRLLWIGEFADRKRPELMIEIARQLASENFPFHLTMLGEGNRHEEIKWLVSGLGLESMIRLPGRQKVQEWIAGSHLMVHTATWEGLPRVLLEGYAMGRRAVAFDVKGVRNIPTICLVEDQDTQAFARAVKSILSDESSLTIDDDPTWIDSGTVAGQIERFLLGSVLKSYPGRATEPSL